MSPSVTVDFFLRTDTEEQASYGEGGDLHCEDPGFIVGGVCMCMCCACVCVMYLQSADGCGLHASDKR